MTEIVPYENDRVFLAPAANIQTALQRYQDMKDFVEKVLRKDTDYGVIPGTGNKPTLLKPGAEKLCAFFGLAVTYELLQSDLDWTGTSHNGEPFFYFSYRVKLLRNGRLAGEGEGSCNSWEKKYRYRKGERKCPKCGAAAIIKGKSEYGGGWLCFGKKGGCGSKFKDGDASIENQSVEDVPNPDIADQVNTLQKMAQKRALIAATLNTTNASDWFTQDIEDFIDGSFEVEPVEAEKVVSLDTLVKDFPDMKPETVAAFQSHLTKNTMTIEDACKVETSKGVQYGTMSAAGIEKMLSAMWKQIKSNGLTAEATAEVEHKIKAAKMVLAAKKSGEIN